MSNSTPFKFITRPIVRIRLFLFTLLAVPGVALAHHPLGGATPATLVEGLLSGIGHPVIGFDHLAFILVAAIFAWLLGKPIQLLMVFIVASALSVFAVSQGMTLPGVESAVLLSLAIAGLVLMLATRVPALVAAFFVAAAGIAHGAAYGDAIIGAETTPLAAYLVGIVLAQGMIALLGIFLVRSVSRGNVESWLAGRLAGAMAFGVALTYGVERLESFMFGV